MAKNKLKKFAEFTSLPIVFEPNREDLIANNWQLNWKEDFGNENPIVLELGCGKGEYTVALGQKNPDKNFIGIDIKGARMHTGAKTAQLNKLQNIRFLRAQIELIDKAFGENEVDEIWITFPDPQIKFRRAKHRLTHPEMLKKYQKILKPGGIIHLKTDSEFLHGYTHGILHHLNADIHFSNHNIYHPDNKNVPTEAIETQTFYEQRFLEQGKAITYLTFSLPKDAMD